jgi:hypothetical protein
VRVARPSVPIDPRSAIALLLIAISCVSSEVPPSPSPVATPAASPSLPPATATPLTPIASATPVAPPVREAGSAVTSGGAVPEAGVIFFNAANNALWRYDGATGTVERVFFGHTIDAEGPNGVYVTALSALGPEKTRGPKLIGWDGVVHDDWCRTIHTIVSFRADGACLYLHPDGVFVRTAPTAGATRLLPADWGARDVAWSPGGARGALVREIATGDPSRREVSVWVLEPDGSLRRLYDAGRSHPFDLRWSGDGVYVSFLELPEGAPFEIADLVVADTLSLEVKRIANVDRLSARAQWLGSALAYVTGPGLDTWRGKELVVRWPGGDPISLMGRDGRQVALAPAWDLWRGMLAWIGGPASSEATAKTEYLAGRGVGERRAYIARPPITAGMAAVGCAGRSVEGVRWSGDGEQLLLLCRRVNEIGPAFELWLQPIADGQAPKGPPRLLVSGLGSAAWIDRGRAPSLFEITGWSRATRPPIPGQDPDKDPTFFSSCTPADRVGLATPPAAGCLTRLRADLDGDGRGDLVMVYADEWGPGHVPKEPAKIQVRFGSGRVWSGTLPGRGEGYPLAMVPQVRFAGDANRDGRDELFVMIDRGASTEFLGMLTWDGKQLVAVQEDTSRGPLPLRLPVGGTVTHGAGFVCASGLLVAQGIATHPPTYDQWDWVRTTYEWAGPSTVRARSRAQGTFEAGLDQQSRPEFTQYWSTRCPSVLP